MAEPSYYAVLTAAINAVAVEGYTSQEFIDHWADQLRRAAERSMRSQAEIDAAVRDALASIFRRQVDQAGVLRRVPGVSAYTLQRMRPELHAELGRRIAASLDLIKLNREEAIEKQTRRFKGWATSIPAGGSETVDRVQEKTDIRKSLASMDFNSRRVVVDQSHKLFNAINTTVAVNGGAIGAVWQSHKYQQHYRGRPAHDARDGTFWLLKGSWADETGLVKPIKAGQYTETIEQPGEFVFCRCAWIWKMSLRSIPPECLTEKGREALAEAKRKVMANA